MYTRVIDDERWLRSKIDILKWRTLVDQEDETLHPNLRNKLMKFEPNEYSADGNTLLTAIVYHMRGDALKQIQYFNLALRAGVDINLADARNGRTPLIEACIFKNQYLVDISLQQPKVNLIHRDRLGNTVLMYAVLCHDDNIMTSLLKHATNSWSFDLFKIKNVMGYTAYDLAVKNGDHHTGSLLEKSRILMLQRMHKQLSLVNFTAKVKHWGSLPSVIKASTKLKAVSAFTSSLRNLNEEYNYSPKMAATRKISKEAFF